MSENLNKRWPWILGALLLLAVAASSYYQRRGGDKDTPVKVISTTDVQRGSAAEISVRCIKCHVKEGEEWRMSDHANANRLVSRAQDGGAFGAEGLTVPGEIWHFEWPAEAQLPHANVSFADDGMTLKSKFAMGIGHRPLIQYLSDVGDGRWQTSRVAWDPAKAEWFDTTPGDDRTRADWGHWTQRGMNWNSNCADCHMTTYNKNYDAAADHYGSSWAEMGIGCTQCHGNLVEHPNPLGGCLIDNLADPMARGPIVMMDSCASCHSRRGEIDDSFAPGDTYADHYQLALPSQPGLWYPDGQILDEDYVWTSFRMSKMGHAGVSCIDCHNPHTAEVKLPLENNALCLQCHSSGRDGAPIINPTAHSFHQEESVGNRCVECHMPHTVYMGRDARLDHGFHIPDPLMTKEVGTPNACNSCHTNQSVDWAVELTNIWYGEKMERPERERTRAVQLAYDGDPAAIDGLLPAYDREEIPAWRATLLGLMQAWANDPRVIERADKAMSDPDALVREAAAGVFAIERDIPRLQKLSEDSVRAVRITASWALIDLSPEDSKRYREIDAYIRHNSDQPTGAIRRAQLLTQRGELDEANKWYLRAIKWNPSSAETREVYAIHLNLTGHKEDAIEQLQQAAKMDPSNSRYPYLLGLGYGELGNKQEAQAAFAQAVEIDPDFARAHYNLGLLLAAQEKLDAAIAAILEAERSDPSVPDYPYARATILLRQHNTQAAMNAAVSALQINQNYQPALALLRQIGIPQPAGQDEN